MPLSRDPFEKGRRRNRHRPSHPLARERIVTGNIETQIAPLFAWQHAAPSLPEQKSGVVVPEVPMPSFFPKDRRCRTPLMEERADRKSQAMDKRAERRPAVAIGCEDPGGTKGERRRPPRGPSRPPAPSCQACCAFEDARPAPPGSPKKNRGVSAHCETPRRSRLRTGDKQTVSRPYSLAPMVTP